MWFILKDTLKGQSAVHGRLWMYSLCKITSCHLHVGGQFFSVELQSWGLRPWNLTALSANCLWVAFKFIDSLGDIVLPLCPQPIVNRINYGSSSLLLCFIADQGPESSVMPSGSALSVGRRGDLYRCLSSSLSNALLSKFVVPLRVSFWDCQLWAPDGRFVDMITQLGSRMDDTVAESKCVTPREVLTPLLNLSSGDQRSEQASMWLLLSLR